jgi:hypothetical protein
VTTMAVMHYSLALMLLLQIVACGGMLYATWELWSSYKTVMSTIIASFSW